jgi:tripartite-type tricarboxylate transporter receptor subunit TctC
MPRLTVPITMRRLGLVCVTVAGFCGDPAPAEAQSYRSRPITLVVGLAPGSGQDVTAWTVARRVSELLGVQIVIENKPGAGTITGSLSVAKAPPLAPAGTPPDIVGKLNGAFNAASQDPGVRGELKAMGFIPEP